jgi:signal peptidase II
MKEKLRLSLTLAAIVVILDHLTKWLIVTYVPQGSEIPVINGFFDIVHGRNTGAAFGVMSAWDNANKHYFFYVMGAVAVVFLYNYLKSIPQNDRYSQIAIGLIFGGALGNLIDRFMRGSVVDFLSVHYYDQIWSTTLFGHNWIIPLTWPAFNVADAAISVSVTFLVIRGFKTPRPA